MELNEAQHRLNTTPHTTAHIATLSKATQANWPEFETLPSPQTTTF